MEGKPRGVTTKKTKPLVRRPHQKNTYRPQAQKNATLREKKTHSWLCTGVISKPIGMSWAGPTDITIERGHPNRPKRKGSGREENRGRKIYRRCNSGDSLKGNLTKGTSFSVGWESQVGQDEQAGGNKTTATHIALTWGTKLGNSKSHTRTDEQYLQELFGGNGQQGKKKGVISTQLQIPGKKKMPMHEKTQGEQN